ncbi:UNVERIFIED_CONTAM: hypothetical protein PYX00_004764 [Menopon gallinae]|uniref:Uncharacterized protein n=1 Tax=Menopon gallinae TaxID=328185 RepID=A0AAW2I565_9NEOP
MMIAKAVFLLAAVACLAAAEEDDGNVKLMMKLVTECGRKDEFGVCLKMRALTFLDKLVRLKEPVFVTDYVKLVRDPKATEEGASEGTGPEPGAGALLKNLTVSGRSLTESELDAVLPRSADERESKLDELLWEKVKSLFAKRSIQLSVPTSVFEGRGDKGGKGGKKGMGGMMMMLGMMKAMMMKMFLAKIALIAGKALIVAKISLVISLIMILKKWASGGHHSEVIYASDHGGHRRSGADDSFLQYAQELAYSAQKP